MTIAHCEVPLEGMIAVVRPKRKSSCRDQVGNLPNNRSHLLVQKRKDSHNVAPVMPVGVGWSTLTVPKAYTNFEDGFIELHIRRRGITNQSEDLCAIFDFSGTRDGIDLWRRGRKVTFQANLSLRHSTINNWGQPVLVGIIDFTQDGQQWGKFWVRAIVRLKPLDSCSNWLANFSELHVANDGIVKIRPTVGNGESEFSFIAGRLRRRFMDRDTVNKMVKGGAHVADTIRSDDLPTLKRGSFIYPCDKTVSGAVRLDLSDDAVRVSVDPGTDFILKGLSVFLAPS